MLQLGCGVLILIRSPAGNLTDYLLLISAAAGFAHAVLPPLLARAATDSRRGGGGSGSGGGGAGSGPEGQGDAVIAALLAVLFAVAGACLISDAGSGGSGSGGAGGSCALNGGRLPARRFGLAPLGPAVSGGGRAMGAAPWVICIAVDLAIAAGELVLLFDMSWRCRSCCAACGVRAACRSAYAFHLLATCPHRLSSTHHMHLFLLSRAAALVNALLFLASAASAATQWRAALRWWRAAGGGAALAPATATAAGGAARGGTTAAAARGRPAVGSPIGIPLPAVVVAGGGAASAAAAAAAAAAAVGEVQLQRLWARGGEAGAVTLGVPKEGPSTPAAAVQGRAAAPLAGDGDDDDDDVAAMAARAADSGTADGAAVVVVVAPPSPLLQWQAAAAAATAAATAAAADANGGGDRPSDQGPPPPRQSDETHEDA